MRTHQLIERAIASLDDECFDSEVEYRVGARGFLAAVQRITIDRHVHELADGILITLAEMAFDVSMLDGSSSNDDPDERLEKHLSRTDFPLKDGIPVPPPDMPPAQERPSRRYDGIMRTKAELACATWLNTLPGPITE